jgi:hypothetical protein
MMSLLPRKLQTIAWSSGGRRSIHDQQKSVLETFCVDSNFGGRHFVHTGLTEPPLGDSHCLRLNPGETRALLLHLKK